MMTTHAIFSREVMRRFVDRVVVTRSVWAVAGPEGLARVESPTWRGRHTTLLWSKPEEAERWGPALTNGAIVRHLTLSDLFIDILPALDRLGRRVGTDWSAEPIEPEIEAGMLGRSLRRRLVEQFIERAREKGRVYVIDGGDGPVLRTSVAGGDQLVLPCWASEEEADAYCDGPWEDALRITIPLDSFITRTLTWLGESNARVAPGFMPGTGVIELAPADLQAAFGVTGGAAAVPSAPAAVA